MAQEGAASQSLEIFSEQLFLSFSIDSQAQCCSGEGGVQPRAVAGRPHGDPPLPRVRAHPPQAARPQI